MANYLNNQTGVGGVNSQPAPYTGAGSQYGSPRPNGWTWGPDAASRFAQNNQIDPNTGMFYPGQEGGLVPWQVGLQYQALSDQGIWRSRQNMMRSGINYARGALGLLQSFRPGGGATIEAGQYNTLAGLEFNRAQMTQPLDLLGDYRREEMASARRQANRAQERQLAVQIAATAATAAFGGVGGIFAGAAGAMGAAAANRNNTQTPNNQAYPQGQQTQSAYQSPGAPMAGPSAYDPSVGPQGPMSPMGAGGQTQQSTLGQEQQNSQAPKAATPQGQQQGGEPGQEQGFRQGAGEQAVGAPGGVGTPTVGANGDFTPVAYAANAAMQLPHPIQQLALSRAAASMIESDPFYATLTTAVNRRWAQRMTA